MTSKLNAILFVLIGLMPSVFAQNAKIVARKIFPSVVEVTTFNRAGEPDSLGSGFFVRPDTVITNLHVIEDASSARISIVGSKTAYDVEGVLGVDRENDLVLLKVRGLRGKPLSLGDITKVETGQEIFALGNPRGLEGTISPGIVSGLNLREIGGAKYIQITAPISPGSSGGPVVDVTGAVIGVATRSRQDSQNLNFAIPVTSVALLLVDSKGSFLKPISSVTIPIPDRRRPAAPPAAPSAGTFFRNVVGIDFAWIHAGEFIMGSPETELFRSSNEGPRRAVTIANGFWMGRYEVTQGQYEAVMETNPSSLKECGPDCPVETVSWNDAKEFIRRLNLKNDGYIYSLPTEAEWEYAARAGTTTAFAFGDSLSSSQANFNGNYPYGNAPKGPYLEKTVKVGSYRPNAWGLYDMHGNVWEWVEDWYTDSYTGLPTDGSANLTAGKREYRGWRGGSWMGSGEMVRSAYRDRDDPTGRYDVGFRLVARSR